ncbi:hypothetical protein H7B90_17675 [Cohnella xylanilytica]|uniref:Uncharacterized protein n=1 Tax=Cohnella xylanilytica TaxID=557555 RepID=A0A841TY92_9BACL|nr:hypothetical protein [Cohnella xylanilytica]MBB6693236.1 hypothetical protein [Cohnella xylanilytica]
MLAELLCIAAVYAFAVVCAHGVARRRSEALEQHYVLVAGNHEDRIEWYMRALQSYSRRSGTDVRVTVVLEESGDGTGAIVEKFARGWDSGIAWQRGGRENLEAAAGLERSYRGVAGFRKGAGASRDGIEERDESVGMEREGINGLAESSDESAGIVGDGTESTAGNAGVARAGKESQAESTGEPAEFVANANRKGDHQLGADSGEGRSATHDEGTDSNGRWRAERRVGAENDSRDRTQTVWVELSKEEDLKRLPI